MPLRLQTHRKISEMPSEEQYRGMIVNGPVSFGVIEFRRMQSNAARLESGQRVFDKIQAIVDRTQVF